MLDECAELMGIYLAKSPDPSCQHLHLRKLMRDDGVMTSNSTIERQNRLECTVLRTLRWRKWSFESHISSFSDHPRIEKHVECKSSPLGLLTPLKPFFLDFVVSCWERSAGATSGFRVTKGASIHARLSVSHNPWGRSQESQECTFVRH